MAQGLEQSARGFEAVSRGALVRLAYRMLGSVDDAEDVVQDAHLRLLGAPTAPDDPGAWLFRTVTNLAIDRLRHLKVQRRVYEGPWLPEPLATPADDGELAAGQAEDLSVGFLLLLERLTVTERVAFVLREAFDLDFNEMARVLGARADACRQRYHRARRKLDGLSRPRTPPADQRRLLERLSEAVLAGDRTQLMALLADDAVVLTDGGGVVSAARVPVTDPARIAQVLLHLAGRDEVAGMTFEWRPLNGGVGVLILAGGAPYASLQAAGAGNDSSKLRWLYIVRNPHKLARLAPART